MKVQLTKKMIKGKRGRQLMDELLRAGLAIQIVKRVSSRFDRR